METEIKVSLINLMSCIKTADGKGIADAILQLDEFVERGRTFMNPQLVHYLRRRSYSKALCFLEGEGDISAGISDEGQVESSGK